MDVRLADTNQSVSVNKVYVSTDVQEKCNWKTMFQTNIIVCGDCKNT